MSVKLLRFQCILKSKNVLSKLFVRNNSVWTSENIVKSRFQDVEIPEIGLNDYVWKILDNHPTKIAAVCGITNRSYTYEKIYASSRIFGANLRKKIKIQMGDTIGVMLPNMPEYLIIFFGILFSGGVATTYNPVYTPYEVQRQLILSETKLIIVHPSLVANVKKAMELSKKNIPIIAVDIDENYPEGTVSYSELVEDNNVDLDILKDVNVNANDVCVLPYSSGTTGMPKGVELTHRNLIANCEQQNTDCRLHSLTTALLLGSHPEVTGKHLQNTNTIICGAAPLPTADIHKIFSKVQHEIHFGQGYGMTEAGPLVSIAPFGCMNYESIGYALPNIQLRVVDEKLNNLSPGQVGELLIKGPNIMKGYRNNPEANKEVFLEDDWYRSGDLAKIEADGLMFTSDRLKELIKVNAYQVPPAELESAIKDHPAVLDAAVIGIPDPITGERPKAFVILNIKPKATEEDIINFVNKRVAPYKKIKEVEFVESIPKNPSGKILRRILKEQHCKK